MAKAVDYMNKPAPDTTLEWGGVVYTVYEVDRGVLYGKHYDRIHWRSRCIGPCGCVVKQTSSLTRPWLRKRCDDCDPGGELDKADRQVFVAVKGHGVAKKAARGTGGASELDTLRAEVARMAKLLEAREPPRPRCVAVIGRSEREGGSVTYKLERDLGAAPLTWTREPGEQIPVELQHLADAIAAADLMGGVS